MDLIHSVTSKGFQGKSDIVSLHRKPLKITLTVPLRTNNFFLLLMCNNDTFK